MESIFKFGNKFFLGILINLFDLESINALRTIEKESKISLRGRKENE